MLWAGNGVSCTRVTGDKTIWKAAMPLSKFLEYLTYGHMIDSLILALSGMLRCRQTEVCVSAFPNQHKVWDSLSTGNPWKVQPTGYFWIPLGSSDFARYSVRLNIAFYYWTEEFCSELYRLVLVDTPLAKYLNGKVTAQDLNELNVELVRNIMYKVENQLQFKPKLNLEAGISTGFSQVLQFPWWEDILVNAGR